MVSIVYSEPFNSDVIRGKHCGSSLTLWRIIKRVWAKRKCPRGLSWLFDIFFSSGGYFYLEPRTLQVLFCLCVLTVRDKLSGYFLKRKASNRTRPKPEFRESYSWVLFGRGTFHLAWIWFIQIMKIEATYEHNVAASMKFVSRSRIDFTVWWPFS